MRADIKQGRNIVKYKKGETLKIYDSALTRFETLSYTYDDKGRILRKKTATARLYRMNMTLWGKVLTADSSIAQQNPPRYRSYYLDSETGYYYLQSR